MAKWLIKYLGQPPACKKIDRCRTNCHYAKSHSFHFFMQINYYYYYYTTKISFSLSLMPSESQ